jgi:uncharacterized protein (TIGR00725 family)
MAQDYLLRVLVPGRCTMSSRKMPTERKEGAERRREVGPAGSQTRRKKAIAVCGTGTANGEQERLAEEMGYAIVNRGFVLVCGGMGGIMEAACRGGQRARAEGASGLVLGILPVAELDGGNGHCDVVIPTGMGVARNVLVVRAADAVVLVGGGAGTLSEAAYAWQFGKPVIALGGSGGWADRLAGTAIDDRRADTVINVASAKQVLETALSLM